MIYLSGHVCKELMDRPDFGFMLNPFMGNALPPTQLWAADTGCFNQPDAFDVARYYRWLERKHPTSCLFATAPDAMGDWRKTLLRSLPAFPHLRWLGYRTALVAQDGATPDTVPWEAFDALFIGGTTDWKLKDPVVIDLLDEAERRGKWRHFGRVNSGDRSLIAKLRGCDSVDGTYLTFGPDINLGQLIEWMTVINRQQSFF